MSHKPIQFPGDFLWGSAASAYQTEGGNYNNDWYRMEQADRALPQSERRFSDPCGNAADHWNHYEADYDSAREMGIQVHRLSTEWSRIVPEEGCIDENALAHYRKMLEALKDRGISVMLCLHHFTIPLWVEAKGGFLKRKVFMKHFSFYVEAVIQALGDLVDYWLPINEPNVVPLGGYLAGLFPPYNESWYKFIKVYRTFFSMQGRSYRLIKKYHKDAPVGVAFAYMHFQPWRKSSFFDRFTARLADRVANGCFFDAVRTGRVGFPLGAGLPFPELKGAMDFVGINYYSTNYMKGMEALPAREGDQVTDMGWILYPRGLYDVLKMVGTATDLPVIVTENGVAATDEAFRIRYLQEHLIQVHRAMEEGINIKGYMVWSLTDNYEWDKGYAMRFGLVHVDFESQERCIKAGGRWYGELIRSGVMER